MVERTSEVAELYRAVGKRLEEIVRVDVRRNRVGQQHCDAVRWYSEARERDRRYERQLDHRQPDLEPR